MACKAEVLEPADFRPFSWNEAQTHKTKKFFATLMYDKIMSATIVLP